MQRRDFIKLLSSVAVGASLDAEMGPVVLFGTGGVDIKPMKDVALAGARSMRPRPGN
jgi:acetyltransferase